MDLRAIGVSLEKLKNLLIRREAGRSGGHRSAQGLEASRSRSVCMGPAEPELAVPVSQPEGQEHLRMHSRSYVSEGLSHFPSCLKMVLQRKSTKSSNSG